MSLIINKEPVALTLPNTSLKEETLISVPPMPHALFANSTSLTPSIEPSTPWKQKAIEMMEEGEKGCTPKQIFAFSNLIKNNKEHLNECVDERRTTVFHELAQYGNPLEFVNILAKSGADFSLLDNFGDTPLMWAIANAHNEMAREILLNLPRSQVDSLNKQCETEENTALHLLVAKGYTHLSFHGEVLSCSNFELLKMIVELGANVNLADQRGNTPLHLAYARRNAPMIEFLLKHGADRNAVNKSGQKPLDLARISGDEDANYAKTKELLTLCVDELFVLNEMDYKNTDKLNKILKL